MMAAMMFPSIAPMVLMHVRIQDGKREQGQPVPAGTTPLFVGGYLITWAAAGLLGYAVFQLGAAIAGDAFSWDNGGPYLAGGMIVAAAALPAHPAEGRLPAPLPEPVHVPHAALAAGAAGRPAPGRRFTAAGALAVAGC